MTLFIYPKWRRQSEPCSWRGGPAPHMWRWSLCPKIVSLGGQTRWRGTLPGCRCPSPGNTVAGSEAASPTTNLRTAGLRQQGVRRGYRQGWLQEGCNWWLTGDRYWPLCSGRSTWGLACWVWTPRWDRGEPTGRSVGPGESGGIFWEQREVLKESETE